MGDVHVIAAAGVLCGSLAFQHKFHLFVAQRCEFWRKFLLSLETPDRNSLLVAVNICKSFTSVEHTEVFRCSHSQKWGGLKSGDRASALFTESLVQVLSDNVEKGCGLTLHAWATREEAHAPGVPVNRSPQKWRCSAPASLLRKITGPPRRWLTQISAGTDFWAYIDWHFFAHLREYYTHPKP
jgi:hypothetical protein